MSALVAVLVAAAGLAGLGPRGRCVNQPSGEVGCERVEARGFGGAERSAGPSVELFARSSSLSTSGSSSRSDAWRPARSLASAVTVVASALRSGQPPASAWRSVLGCPVGPDGVPGLEDLLEATEPESGRARAALARVRLEHPGLGRVIGSRSTSRQRAVREQRAMAVVAAGRLAATLGAPLAPVLDRVAESIVADDEVDGERRAALAGPRSTAAVLGWLPLLGVALGVALGADPIGVVLRGGIGTSVAVVGCILVVTGRWWTSRLVRRAMLASRS